MKSADQLLLGLIAAVGSSLLVLAAASLALLEGDIYTTALVSTAPVEPSATGPVLTLTTLTVLPLTSTPTQAQPTSCPTPEGWAPYVVQPGDTLETLAEQAGLTAEQVQKSNCLTGTSLFPNTILYLPFVRPTETAPTLLPTVLPTLLPTVQTTTLPSATPIPCGPPRGWITYVVRPGDTLFRLSLAFGVSQYELQRANCMTGTGLIAGQRLWVPNVPTRVPSFTNTPVPPSPTNTPETPTDVPTTEVPATVEPTITNTTAPSPTNTTEPSATPVTPTAVTPTTGTVELETATSQAPVDTPTSQ